MTLERRTRLTRKTRLRAFSPKRAAERPTRAKVVAEVLARDGSCCQVAYRISRFHDGITHSTIAGVDVPLPHCPWDCWYAPEGPDPHEIIPRSAWKAGYLEVDNVIMVCRLHHQWIDGYPDEAHLIGMHGYSWERPDSQVNTAG